MQKNQNPQIIPMAAFTQAALQHFKCKPEDIEIRMIGDNKEAIVLYQEQAYKISTRETLREDVEDMLTHTDHAQSVNLSLWIKATVNTVEIGRVLPKLVRKLEDVQQARILRLALTINSYSEDKYETFWRTLERLDHTGMSLSNAIVSAREVYDGIGLLDDMVGLMIINGINEYNTIQGGIFETVFLDDNVQGYPEFYIYSTEHPFTD
jgi:hypothetical protein